MTQTKSAIQYSFKISLFTCISIKGVPAPFSFYSGLFFSFFFFEKKRRTVILAPFWVLKKGGVFADRNSKILGIYFRLGRAGFLEFHDFFAEFWFYGGILVSEIQYGISSLFPYFLVFFQNREPYFQRRFGLLKKGGVFAGGNSKILGIFFRLGRAGFPEFHDFFAEFWFYGGILVSEI